MGWDLLCLVALFDCPHVFSLCLVTLGSKLQGSRDCLPCLCPSASTVPGSQKAAVQIVRQMNGQTNYPIEK